jgi:UDP-N-acetylmuramoyl-L-alanyl-D-glutamate--2,6-diaminopimelate ligase
MSALSALKSLVPEQSPVRLAWHKAKALAAAARYGMPARTLTVIGVTGTDGKTTTVGMVAHILNVTGRATGALSTAYFRVGDEVRWNATQKTSPSPFVIQKFLRTLVAKDCTHAVLEVSSHGLVQSRMICTWPRVAGITNLSPEHLDYHGTMDEYQKAKKKLFLMLGGKGTKVLNAADRTFADYSSVPAAKSVHYSTASQPPAEGSAQPLWSEHAVFDREGIRATVHTGALNAETHELFLPMAGAFNLDNALCAIGCAIGCGVPVADAIRALKDFRGIPGRMERIDEGQDFAVFVDFTVTPAAYEKTLGTLKAMLKPGQRLLALTGSCGDRMKEKRPHVGRIVSEHADVMVVANEDPYTEDPQSIIDEVWAGVDQSKTEAHRIFDRRDAIAFLLENAKPGDIVVLCGKGSDTTMWVKEGKIPWNEREIVRGMLKKHTKAPPEKVAGRMEAPK